MLRRRHLVVALVVIATAAAACGGGGGGGGGGGKRVALVLSGPIGVNPFLKAIKDGFEQGAKEFGYEGTVVESKDQQAITENVRSFASQGYGLVIANSFESIDAVTAVSKEFPDGKFAIIDTEVKAPNVRSAVFREYEAAFLVGVEGAKLSKTGKLGFVGALDIPLLTKWWGGMQQGMDWAAQNGAEKTTLIKRFTGSFEDVAKGKDVALSEIQQGADFILPAAGAGIFGAFEACAEKKVACVGVDADQRGQNPYVIDAQLKHTDVATYQTVKDFNAGAANWGSTVSYGIKEKGVGLASVESPKPISDKALGDNVLAELKKLSQQIADGQITVKNPLEK